MSHDGVEPGRSILYNLPAQSLPTLYSDALRSLEFSRFFSDYRGPHFEVCTGDGWSWPSPAPHRPEFVARFRTRAHLDAVIGGSGEAALGRKFLEGALEIQGNIFAALAAAEYALLHADGLSNGIVQSLTRMSGEWTRRLLRARRSPALQNWHCAPCPIDLPASFFEPWLGPLLAHGCASFHAPDDAFGAAQRNGLDRACAWLDLSSCDRLLEVGCGWGSLLLHAAREHRIHALGVVSSQTQTQAARERLLCACPEPQAIVEHRDLCSAPYAAGSFNKLADIGVFEQVPSADLGKYLDCMRRMLAPGGLFLLHRMTPARSGHARLRTLHPGLPSEPVSKDLAVAEAAGWELLDVETLAEDYAATLYHWITGLRQALERNVAPALTHAYRAWLLYLVEIAACLHAQELQIHRLLLRRSDRRRAPKSTIDIFARFSANG